GANACTAMTNVRFDRASDGAQGGMDNLKLSLSLCVFGAMIVLCVLRMDWAGVGGLGCGALGFVGWFAARGQTTLGERFGNGYIGAFFGLCLGFAMGGVAELIWRQLQSG